MTINDDKSFLNAHQENKSLFDYKQRQLPCAMLHSSMLRVILQYALPTEMKRSKQKKKGIIIYHI